jgi:hypothetical protein
MATLTGQFISQSYGGIIQLSTNTGIITGSSTQLQDGLGNSLGLFIQTTSAGSGSLTGSGDFRINGLTVGRGGGDRNSNTAVGVSALVANTSAGSSNTAIGSGALLTNSVGDNNTAVGSVALVFNTSGSDNIAVGVQSLYSLTSGSSNTAVGINTLFDNITGNNNTAVGGNALFQTVGDDNTAVGRSAMSQLRTGSDNTVIGYNTGLGIITGSNNTILGANVTGLSSSLSNNIILADGAGNIRLRYSGSWTYSGSIAGGVNTLTITSQTASVDLSTGNLFTLTLVSGSTTNINPTNIRAGQTSMIQITQPSGGGGSVSFNTSVKFPTGFAYTASIGSSVVDTIAFVSFDGSTLRSVASYNFQ